MGVRVNVGHDDVAIYIPPWDHVLIDRALVPSEHKFHGVILSFFRVPDIWEELLGLLRKIPSFKDQVKVNLISVLDVIGPGSSHIDAIGAKVGRDRPLKRINLIL